MSFRQVTIKDGVTVMVGDANSSRIDELLDTLKKSVALTKDGPLTDSTPVIWDGEPTTWGSLSQNERMCCERNADGVLEGANPF